MQLSFGVLYKGPPVNHRVPLVNVSGESPQPSQALNCPPTPSTSSTLSTLSAPQLPHTLQREPVVAPLSS